MASNFWSNIPFWGDAPVRVSHISKTTDMLGLCTALEKDLDQIIALEKSLYENEDISQPPVTIEQKEEGERPEMYETCETLALRLKRMKRVLYEDKSTNPEHVAIVSNLKTSIISSPTLVPKLIKQLPSEFMPFESRKNIAAIFNNLIVRGGEGSTDAWTGFALFVFNHYDEIMKSIILNHAGDPDVALLCGSMMRSTLRHENLYRRLLSTDGEPNCAKQYVYPLLDSFVNLPNFDVSSDALATVRAIFVNDRLIASEYLERDYDNVIFKFNINLQSTNYITRRLSLKLLGEILLDRSNFNVMMKYISSKENLKTIMLLLSDPSPNIQFEAFHVFKIFVANPNKQLEVTKVLTQNKIKLVAYLEKFHCEKEKNDDQFRDEKVLIITTLNALE